MSSMEAGGAPLLNDYKLEFFWKRFPQTLLGGGKLRVGSETPFYVYLNQICVLVCPLLLGGLFTLLVELNIIPADLACYVYSSLMILTVLCLQLLSWLIRKNSSNVGKLDQNVFSEEDEVDFESCCGIETVDFILPEKKFIASILLHTLASGPLCGLMFMFLLPSNIQTLFSSTGATVVIFVFGWLSVCIAQYSLTVGPPEVAIFRTQDTLDITSFMRPFYLSIFGVVGILSSVYSELASASMILHVVLPFLPLLWILGILPPLDALFSWLGEQALVLALGGSPMATDLRLLIMVLVSSIILVISCFLPTSTSVIIIASCFGFILSWDWPTIISWVWNRLSNREGSNPQQKWHFKNVFIHGVLFVTTVAVSTVSHHELSPCFNGGNECKELTDIFGYLFIIALIFCKICGDLQSVYIFFGLVRNYFYPSNVHTVGALKDKKKHLDRLAVIRHVVITYVTPLMIVSFLGLVSQHIKSGTGLFSFAVTLATIRTFRWAWQNTTRCLTELVIVFIITWTSPTNVWWNSLGLGLQLLIVGAVWNRTVEFLWKFLFAATLMVTSWADKKQRHTFTIPLLTASLITLPVLIGIIAICSVLSAPLLPLFCLPLFLIGFPRPLRSWPDAGSNGASHCADTALYAQLSPEIQKSITSVLSSGSLDEPSPGDHYLIRYQDRMAWVHILERGFNFVTMVIKGLEIQETSCHTVEATRIDDIIEASLAQEAGSSVYLNPYFGNTLRLCDALIVNTYSDARNVLTGIIEQPDNLKRNTENFMKTLVWVLLHHCKDRQNNETGGNTGEETVPKTPLPKRHEEVAINIIDRKSSPSPSVLSKTDVRKRTRSVSSIPESLWSKEDLEESFSAESFSSKSDLRKKKRNSAVELVSVKKKDPKLVLGIEDEDEFGFGGLPITDTGRKTNSCSKDSGFGSTLKKAPSIPGMLDELEDDNDDNGDDDDLEDEIFRNLIANKQPIKSNTVITHETISTKPTSESARHIQLPAQWRNEIPMDYRQLEKLKSSFPDYWYKHVVSVLDFGSDRETIAKGINEDSALKDMYRQLVLVCYSIVDIMGLTGMSAVSGGPHHIYKVFSGNIPWSIYLDWLDKDQELKSLVLKAYRYAFKLTYDEAVLGEADTEEELTEYLQEYDNDWFMGSEQEGKWTQAMGEGVPTLFSLGYDKNKGAYTSHILTKQEVIAPISRLNREAVRGQWASLALELLYMTNDDEERYSIQAHPTLLRNLTIQAADNPLGYAIYSSGAVSVQLGLW